MSKAALSLPGSPPVFLSQALHSGFNGHKPTLFVKGEGWLNGSVVNKIITTEIWHSPKLETAVAPLVYEPEGSSWAPLHTPCLPSEPLDTTEPKRCFEHADTVSAGTEPIT
jgi:hypothetical protein